MSYIPPPYWILTGIHHYRSTKGTGWCELIQVNQYQIWILYQWPSFENAPWEQDVKKRAVTKPGSYKYKYGLPHHPPSREEHGDRSAIKYGFGKERMQLTGTLWLARDKGLTWVIKHMDMADQFKATQFCVLRKLCWGQGMLLCRRRTEVGDLLRRPNTHLARTLIFQVSILLRDRPTNTTPYTDNQLKLKPALMCSREAGSLEFCSPFLI